MSSDRLVGREQERAEIADLVRGARSGQSVTIVVRGEAGIGKTRLINDAIERERRADDVILIGQALDLASGELPFGVAATALRDLALREGVDAVRALAPEAARALAPLLPELGVGAAAPLTLDRLQVFGAFATLLTRINEGRFTWLVVEDLHWADASSRDLLGYVARVVRPPARMVIVCTLRDDDGEPSPSLVGFVDELLRLPGTRSIRLDRLGASDVRDQLIELLGDPPSAAFAERIAALANGVPFLVEELVASGVSGGDDPLPRSVFASMLTRVAKLSAPTQRLIQAGSLGAGHLRHSLLASASGLDEDDVDEAVRGAVNAKVLEINPLGDGYQFRHDLMRAAVASSMLPADRIRWHRRWAVALETDPDGGEHAMSKIAAAHHWAETDDRERALESGLRAAELAHTLGAEAERATLLTRILDRWPRLNGSAAMTDEARDDVLDELMWAHSWGGSLSTALDLIETELAEADEGDRVRLLYLELTRGRLLRKLGYPGSPRPDATVREAIAVLSDAPRNALFFRCVAELASGTGTQEMAGAVDGLLSDAIERAAECPTRALDRWHLNGAMSHHLRVLDRDDESATMLLALLPQVRQEFPPSAVGTWEANTTHRLATVGRFSEAAEVGRGALDRLGDPRAAPRLWAYVAQSLADPLTELGEWDEAEQHLARAVDISSHSARVLLDLGLICSLRGDVDAATSLRTRAVESAPDEPEVDYQIAESLLASHIAMTVGDLATARRALGDVWRREGYRRDYRMWRVILLAVQVEVMARAATARARTLDSDLMEHIMAASRSTKAAGILGVAWDAHLVAEEARHHGSDSPVLWQAAVEGWSATRQVHDKAWALLSLAVAQLDVGDRPAATTAVSDALAIGHKLRALPLIRKAELVARRGRMDIHRFGQERTPTSTNLHGLTARELEVLQLVAGGRSNDDIAQMLFISPKTASVHVSRILTKLGLTSRTAAAAFAYREGIVEP